jgi:uncharacterized protein (DUF1499 family)
MRHVSVALCILTALTCFSCLTDAEEVRVTDEKSTEEAAEGSSGMRLIRPCESSPNCVSSVDDRPARHIAPYRLTVAADEARKELIAILEGMPRMSIVEKEGSYLHAEAKSGLFGFTDDVEFLLSEEEGLIHARSASRAGYWDLGVNRRRLEGIGERLRAAGMIR